MKRKTVRSAFFLSYMGIAMILFVCTVGSFTIIQAPKVKEQTVAALSQNIDSVAAAVDLEMEQMNTVAMNIAYSSQIRDRFFDTSHPYSDYSDTEDARLMAELLGALILPNRPVDQIDLYNRNGMRISSGVFNGVYSAMPDERPWYEEMTDTETRTKVMYAGEDPLISKYFTDKYGKRFFSYVMQIFDSFNNPYGYVEVRQRMSRVISSVLDYSSVYGERIYVVDSNGRFVYSQSSNDAGIFLGAKKLGFPEELTALPAENGGDMVLCRSVQDGSFYIMVAIKPYEMQQPMYSFLSNMAIITAVAMFLSLLFAFIEARRITNPLGEICERLSSFDAADSEPLVLPEVELEELNTLSGVFSKMQEKLSDSMAKQMLLQKQEMQSKMLALQSQMNPHFLFNSLATIQAMADEGLNSEISDMCQSMANILRYISSDAEQEVPLADEISHTTDYLRCMCHRYQGDLTYSINIPEDMMQVRIPKLCVQLLAENAIKYSAKKRPPYFVSIQGRLMDDGYEISINDNGPGFSQEAIDLLNEKIAEINSTNTLPSLEINGMGMLNVYIRFRLIHGDRIIFRITNRPTGGASVTMGVINDE